MSYQVLARKWRPQTFDEVIGQDHIVRSIVNQVSSNSLGHAFLFTGTRGVGKTSMARILSKSVRCLSVADGYNPCNECACCEDTNNDSSMDVVEIDGASNNSVDNIREIIETSKFLPVIGSKRIFIIDEVHMLSSSAFNALLKTLEEPPAHVLFIFATTEPEKIPTTVLSRCQKYDFLEISNEDLAKQIQKISIAENISFESDDVIRKLCDHGDGSVRDTLTLLEQALMYSNDKYISSQLLESSLGIIQDETIDKILEMVLCGEPEKLKINFKKVQDSRVQTDHFVLEFGKKLYALITLHTQYGGGKYSIEINGRELEITNPELMWIFDVFSKEASEALNGIFSDLAVEIVLLKLCMRKEILRNAGLKVKGSIEESKSQASASQSEVGTKAIEIEQVKKCSENVIKEVTEVNEKLVEEKKTPVQRKTWEDFLNNISETSPATASNLEQGNIVGDFKYEENKFLQVILGFSSEAEVFFDYLSEKGSRERIVSELSGFYNLNAELIDFELRLLDDNEKERIGFNSLVEIDEMNKEEEKNKKKEMLLKNSLIKEAQNLFKTEVDKTIIV